jgi:hypothetical protein
MIANACMYGLGGAIDIIPPLWNIIAGVYTQPEPYKVVKGPATCTFMIVSFAER